MKTGNAARLDTPKLACFRCLALLLDERFSSNRAHADGGPANDLRVLKRRTPDILGDPEWLLFLKRERESDGR